MRKLYVAFGSNKGSRLTYIELAVKAIPLNLLRTSNLYETRACYSKFDTGSPYLNCVCEFDIGGCDLEQLLRECQKIEIFLHRPPDHKRYLARTIDIDFIAAVDDDTGAAITHNSHTLTLPHPASYDRRFVLQPLHELSDAAMLPRLPPEEKGATSDRLAYSRPSECLAHINKMRLKRPDAPCYAFLNVVVATSIADTLPIAGSLMSIVNVTHNSFSEGEDERLVTVNEQGTETLNERRIVDTVYAQARWSDVVDIGAMPSHPMRPLSTEAEELERWQNIARSPTVLRCLTGLKTPISVDTIRRSVIDFAHDTVNCSIWNNVEGNLMSDEDLKWCINHQVTLIVSHWNSRDAKVNIQENNTPVDLAAIMRSFDTVKDRWDKLGGFRWRLIFDPGLGFGKTATESKAILDTLSDPAQNIPMILGFSRKKFLSLYTLEDLTIKGALQDKRDSKTAALCSKYSPYFMLRVHKNPRAYRDLSPQSAPTDVE